MKKALLASTAIVGAALLTAPAQAGTVGSGDNMAVKMSGVIFFQASTLDTTNSDGYGRGYNFRIPETEVNISASNTADNGLKYGVTIELETNTDYTGGNSDEVYGWVSGDFGRIEMGDQDDAVDRMYIGAHATKKGASGTSGGLLDLNSLPGVLNENLIQRGDFATFTTSDDTKITYFSPRFSGFQVGASFTPDLGAGGASYDTDNNGNYEDVISLAANYVGKFDDVGVSASISYQTGEFDDGGAANEDLEQLGIGAKVDFAGFSVGANWHDNNDSFKTKAATAGGTDAGSFWAVGAGYSQGPWGDSVYYTDGERDESNVEISVTRWGIGAGYAVAPGWKVTADYIDAEIENKSGTAGNNVDASAFLLTSQWSF